MREDLEFQPVALRDVLSESASRLKGSKTSLLLGTALLILANLLALLLSTVVAPGSLLEPPTLLENVTTGLIGAVVSSPILGGFALMALKRARGQAIDPGMIMSGTRYATRFLTYGIITTGLSLLVWFLPALIGQLLWLVVGVLLTFTAYFIVDRDLGAGHAMLASLAMVLSNPAAVTGWMLLGVALSLAAVLTLGIGLIWLLPFLLISNAMLYLHALGEPAEVPAA